MQQVWYHILTVNLIMLSSSTDSATFSINVFWISEGGEIHKISYDIS